MKRILFLISISLLIYSCNKEEDSFKPLYCSPANLYSPCENTDEICYKGSCILKTLKCGGDTDAPCDNGNECKRDDITREYKCFEGRCSTRNLDGYCRNNDEYCFNGYCKKPCSKENYRGGCENKTDTCFDYVCLPKNDICKTSNPNGQCNTEDKCSIKENGSIGCVRLCHKDDNADDDAYKKMPCPNSDEICVKGECLHKDNRCEILETGGECPSFQTCIDKKCENKCSEDFPTGVCQGSEQDCVDGVCEFNCSVNHPNGYCKTSVVGEAGGCQLGDCKKVCGDPTQNSEAVLDGYCEGVDWCKNGVCELPCDIDHKNGLCEDENDYCNNGVCEKRLCGQDFPDGYCPKIDNLEQRCVDNECIKPCSNDTLSGWCEEGKFCSDGSCKTPEQILCGKANGIKCIDLNKECIANKCILKPCSVGFDGRCEQLGQVCYPATGECIVMCQDYRRIICKNDETPEVNGCINKSDMNNSSSYGACCNSNIDCSNLGDSINIDSNYRCIDDGNSSSGAYCNKIGVSACSNDSDCSDPYPYKIGEENTQKYYCSSYYDQVKMQDISFCERTANNCDSPRTKEVGEFCNENCNDSECALGTHCIDGICTLDCHSDNSCPSVNNGKQLECSLYFDKKIYPGFSDKITSKICRNICTSNKDCKLSKNECNHYYNRRSNIDDNLPLFSTCGNKNVGIANKLSCENDDECSSKLCVNNICTKPCLTHEDCGSNAYCDYEKALIIDNKTINFMGVCKYLARGTIRKDECNSSNDCLSTTVTVGTYDRHYKCLKYIDESDTTRGICGVQKLITGAIPSNEARPCNTQNHYCESGLCVNDNIEINNTEGKCRELCSSTSDCNPILENGISQKQICKRIKFRDGALETNNNREVYGGVCLPVLTSSLSDCSVNTCSGTETCILNPVNSHTDTENSWKFSIEYLCVLKNPAGKNFGETCSKDSDCESNLCSILTDKCVTACKTDSQCSGLGTETCNINYPAVYDINSVNWILGGVCE